MRFLLITTQVIVIVFAAQIVALIGILVFPESHFSKTMAIALIPSIILFALLFRHTKSGIFDAFSAVGRTFGFLGKASDFFLGIYAFILILFLFTLSHFLWMNW